MPILIMGVVLVGCGESDSATTEVNKSSVDTINTISADTISPVVLKNDTVVAVKKTAKTSRVETKHCQKKGKRQNTSNLELLNSGRASVVATTQEVDLGLSVNWSGFNMGASSPEEYGSFYAWGDVEPKDGLYEDAPYKYLVDSVYVDLGANICGTEYDVARHLWGEGWRLPSKKECEELKNNCRWEWTEYRGVKGMKVIGPNGNCIFLPAAGWQNSTLNGQGDNGNYWSGSLHDKKHERTWRLGFNNNGVYIGSRLRDNWHSVRPIKERNL